MTVFKIKLQAPANVKLYEVFVVKDGYYDYNFIIAGANVNEVKKKYNDWPRKVARGKLIGIEKLSKEEIEDMELSPRALKRIYSGYPYLYNSGT